MMKRLFYIIMSKRVKNVILPLKAYATLEFDRFPRQLQYHYPFNFKRPLFDGHIVDIIENVLTRERRINKRSHSTDQGSTHILRRYQIAIY